MTPESASLQAPAGVATVDPRCSYCVSDMSPPYLKFQKWRVYLETVGLVMGHVATRACRLHIASG